jgi:hypothetical protein
MGGGRTAALAPMACLFRGQQVVEVEKKQDEPDFYIQTAIRGKEVINSLSHSFV